MAQSLLQELRDLLGEIEKQIETTNVVAKGRGISPYSMMNQNGDLYYVDLMFKKTQTEFVLNQISAAV